MESESVSHSVLSYSLAPVDCVHQASLSMDFSRQEYRNGLPVPYPGDLPDPGIEPRFPTLQADSLLFELPGNPFYNNTKVLFAIFHLHALMGIKGNCPESVRPMISQ